MSSSNLLSRERHEELNAFLAEFQGESHRGAALLGAAMIDDCLRKIIIDFFIDRRKVVKDLVDGGYAPLSTLSARAKVVYCLGLISRCEYFNINIIRSVRNKFAHRLHGLSFSDPEIAELCRKLKYDTSAVGLIFPPTPRHSFILATAVLVSNLSRIEVNHRPVKMENNDWKPMPSLEW